jgi:CheY-like chemotaxis protein
MARCPEREGPEIEGLERWYGPCSKPDVEALATRECADSPVPGPLSILVVEDDVRSGRMLADLLRGDGFTVEVCPGGASGAERLASGPAPDALVTDLRMPEVDGVAVVRLARSRSPAMPILIVTAYPELARRLERDPAPSPTIFTKPLDYAALVATLSRIRGGARS